MKILTIPHPTLRQQAEKVVDFDADVSKFTAELAATLLKTTNPRGVGLAAVQVGVLQRIFATQIKEKPPAPEIVINPVLVKHSKKHTFGPDPKNPRLEGCLSMPLLYGPVPRWEWVQVEYQTLQGGKMVEKKERFEGFHARVVQHEMDHLEGILFTDYALQYDLPVYRETKKELVEITDRRVLELY